MITPVEFDQVLDQWEHWEADISERPIATTKLSNGLANQCWKVDSGEQAFVVRLGSPLVTRMHCSWEQELRSTTAGGHLGIAPRIVYSQPQCRVLVLEWGGLTADASSLQSEIRLRQLADILSRLHKTVAMLSAPGYVQTLEHYMGLIPAAAEFPADLDMLSFARYLDMDTQSRVFCHHDLNLGNLLIDGVEIKLIDWEYARMGHALFDLGSLIDTLKLSPEQSSLLLGAYGAPASYLQNMADMQRFIRYLQSLWTVAMSSLRKPEPEC